MPELLMGAGNRAPFTPGILAGAHRLNAEFSLMLLDKDILHFRRFAKYVAAYWRMASSSSRSANCLLRRAISAACSLSRSEDVAWLCCLLRQL